MEKEKPNKTTELKELGTKLPTEQTYAPTSNIHREHLLIDTHAHIYYDDLYSNIDQLMKECSEKGVERIYMPNVDSESVDKMLELERRYPERLFAMMGLHPCSVKENYKEELKMVEDLLAKKKFSAVGEIGIDHYWTRDFDSQQEEAFEFQLDLALRYNLPVSIHSRNSLDTVIDILKRRNKGKVQGILHCFTGNIEQAKTLIEMGLLLGIGGVVTFKNSGLDKVVAQLEMEKLVLETDSPYLAPVPFRGKPNSPVYLNIIAQKISELKNISVEEVAKITSDNAKTIFK